MAKRPPHFAVRIRELAAEKKLNMGEVARLAGMSPQQFSDTLNGVDPRLSTLERIAKALGVGLSTLFAGRSGKELKPVDEATALIKLVQTQEELIATLRREAAYLRAMLPSDRLAALEDTLKKIRPSDN